MTYIFRDHDGDRQEFNTLMEAKQAYKNFIFNYAEIGWDEDIVLNCEILKRGKTICKPVMIDQVMVKNLDGDELEMAEAYGWKYTCDYEMQEVLCR